MSQPQAAGGGEVRIKRPGRAPYPWGVLAVRLLVAALCLALSDRIALGPRWLMLALIAIFFVPINLARWRDAYRLTRRLTLTLAMLSALIVTGSAVQLVLDVATGPGIPAPQLLRDGAIIWFANILVFALWYWQLDAHGPDYRHHHRYATLSTDFLFPQQTVSNPLYADWRPGFVDYLFVAFNASTAFSPTDTLVLTPRAKWLMMAQSLVSIVVVAVLVARAINTLGG